MTDESPRSNNNKRWRLSQSPAGRKQLPREFVESHQRQRAVTAVAEIAHEHGISELTATRIVRGAQMSRNTFYDLFGSKDECLRLAFQEAHERLFGPVRAANEVPEPWLDRLSAALEVFFTAIVEEPLLAELCLIHSFGAAAGTVGCDYEAGIAAMMEVMHGGREAGRTLTGEDYCEPLPQVEEFLARAIVSLAATRIRRGEAERLLSHRGELVRLAATPFLGIDEAARVGTGIEAA